MYPKKALVRACMRTSAQIHAMCPRLVISFFSFRPELALDFDLSEVGVVAPDSFICHTRAHRTHTHSQSHTTAHEYAHKRRENAGQLAGSHLCLMVRKGQAVENVQTGRVTYSGTAIFTYARTAFSAMTLSKNEFRCPTDIYSVLFISTDHTTLRSHPASPPSPYSLLLTPALTCGGFAPPPFMPIIIHADAEDSPTFLLVSSFLETHPSRQGPKQAKDSTDRKRNRYRVG